MTNISKKSKTVISVLLKVVKIEKPVAHEILMVIRRHGLLLLKIYVSLLVQALQEDDETKRLLDTNSVEHTFFKTTKTPKRSQNL